MDNGKTLGFRGDMAVKYVDILSREEPITMMVRIKSGGGWMVQSAIVIFKNANFTYPICGVTDDVRGVS